MISMLYKSPDNLSIPKINTISENIINNMEFGESVVTGGNVQCRFFYGDSIKSPVGLANVMSSGSHDLSIRLIAPDEPSLKKLTESLGVPYDEARVEEE